MKDFDTFSFKPKTKKESSSEGESIKSFGLKNSPPSSKNWRQMEYRFEKHEPIKFEGKYLNESKYINEKISKIDDELSQNIKRRIQLENQMYKNRQQERQVRNEQFFKERKIQPQPKMAKNYANMEKRSDYVQNMLNRSELRIRQMERQEQQRKQKQERLLSNTLKNKAKDKKIGKSVIPCQIKVQQLLKKVTFPALPKQNLYKLQKECATLAINNDHSDLIYMLMVLNFHLQNHKKVRDFYREILMYKSFEPNAYWVACQTEYELQNYDLCLKLADKCMKQVPDQHLPRFIFLQARSYEHVGNFINSIVCYNQLIKIRPNVAEFYLERAMIYDKIGYPKQAKEDYTYFSVLNPECKEYIKEKILTQESQRKRKQLIKALAKLS